MVFRRSYSRKAGIVAIGLVLVLAAGCGDEASRRAGGQGASDEATTVADLFPDTGMRGYVINNCSSCHSAACLVIGQRDFDEWRAIEASHETYIPGLSTSDHALIFDYLRRHFGADQPEPEVPPEFLQDGCPTL